jgi:hypothetical protein
MKVSALLFRFFRQLFCALYLFASILINIIEIKKNKKKQKTNKKFKIFIFPNQQSEHGTRKKEM